VALPPSLLLRTHSHSLNHSINHPLTDPPTRSLTRQRHGCTAQATEARLKVQTHIHTNVEAVETIIERVAKAHQLHIDGVDKLLGALSADASPTTTPNPPPPPPPPPPHVDVSAGSASTPPLLTPQPDPPFHGTGLLWVPTSELIPAVFDNDHTYRTPLELLQTEENRWRDVLLRHTGRRPKVGIGLPDGAVQFTAATLPTTHVSCSPRPS
jgi:hypothetical protein